MNEEMNVSLENMLHNLVVKEGFNLEECKDQNSFLRDLVNKGSSYILASLFGDRIAIIKHSAVILISTRGINSSFSFAGHRSVDLLKIFQPFEDGIDDVVKLAEKHGDKTINVIYKYRLRTSEDLRNKENFHCRRKLKYWINEESDSYTLTFLHNYAIKEAKNESRKN